MDPELDGVARSRAAGRRVREGLRPLRGELQPTRRGCPIGPDARASLKRSPNRRIPGHGQDGRKATDRAGPLAAISAMYSQERWPALAKALHELDTGNASGVFSLADQYNERTRTARHPPIDANITINCTDEKVPRDGPDRAAATAMAGRIPALRRSPGGRPCWAARSGRAGMTPTGGRGGRGAAHRRGGNAGDPATPYATRRGWRRCWEPAWCLPGRARDTRRTRRPPASPTP